MTCHTDAYDRFDRLDTCDDQVEETGLWVVEPDLDVDGAHILDVIDARTIFRSVHLIPVFGGQPIPPYMKSSDALDSY